jgi:hypothetical protein
LLNPKPPDPEAAFAFPAFSHSGRETPEEPPEDRAASNLEAQLMTRSTQIPTRARAAAYDFDVVTDVTPRPARKPDAVPDTAHPKPGPAPATTAKA